MFEKDQIVQFTNAHYEINREVRAVVLEPSYPKATLVRVLSVGDKSGFFVGQRMTVKNFKLTVVDGQ